MDLMIKALVGNRKTYCVVASAGSLTGKLYQQRTPEYAAATAFAKQRTLSLTNLDAFVRSPASKEHIFTCLGLIEMASRRISPS